MAAMHTIGGVVSSCLEDQKDHARDRQDSWANNMRKDRPAIGDDFGSQYTRCNDQDYSEYLTHLVFSLYLALLGSRDNDCEMGQTSPPPAMRDCSRHTKSSR